MTPLTKPLGHKAYGSIPHLPDDLTKTAREDEVEKAEAELEAATAALDGARGRYDRAIGALYTARVLADAQRPKAKMVRSHGQIREVAVVILRHTKSNVWVREPGQTRVMRFAKNRYGQWVLHGSKHSPCTTQLIWSGP